jgi:hypothetical protein
MRLLLISAVLAASAAVPAATPAATSSSSKWASQANEICVVWLAKANKEFGKPAQFVKILKLYLNDERPKQAFAAAGAGKCG